MTDILQKAIICDLDGTLSFANGRDWYDASTCDEDKLNEPVAKVVEWAEDNGYTIIFLSGRMAKYKEPTQRFLTKYGFNNYELAMRATDDNRKDSIVKRELYEEYVLGKYDVLFILDDRKQVVDMWRLAFGLTVFQVAEGNL